jgi:hypothetical protein
MHSHSAPSAHEPHCRRPTPRYFAQWDQPRPESLQEDCQLAAGLAGAQRSVLLRHVASACESGWDFSSRWFEPGGGLGSVRTTRVGGWTGCCDGSVGWHVAAGGSWWQPAGLVSGSL